MHEKYLGDSFDIVKRFWAERLNSVAPLFAHPFFVSKTLRPRFEKMTTIPVLQPRGQEDSLPFGVFLDPHTGIPLPGAVSQKATPSHASLSFIEKEFDRLAPMYLICYDQSHDRFCGLSPIEQRDQKRAALRAGGLSTFYYVSHASFLFAAKDAEALARILARLVGGGIPRTRFEPSDIEE